VVKFLSDEWVAALDEAAPAAGACDPELDGLVIGYDVDDFAYHLVFSSTGVRARPGTDAAATVTFRCDRATAVAIAQGSSSAQRAFMAGKLRIGGDASALLRAHGAIAALPDLFAAIRPETDYE
jgi:putative sterol carrier protein